MRKPAFAGDPLSSRHTSGLLRMTEDGKYSSLYLPLSLVLQYMHGIYGTQPATRLPFSQRNQHFNEQLRRLSPFHRSMFAILKFSLLLNKIFNISSLRWNFSCSISYFYFSYSTCIVF